MRPYPPANKGHGATLFIIYRLQEVHKARAFQTYLGYNLSNADELIQNVLENIGQYEAVKKQDPKGYGERLTVTMMLKGPNGKEEPVRTGWIIDKEKDEIRMTSIYVNRRKTGKSQRKAKKKKG